MPWQEGTSQRGYGTCFIRSCSSNPSVGNGVLLEKSRLSVLVAHVAVELVNCISVSFIMYQLSRVN